MALSSLTGDSAVFTVNWPLHAVSAPPVPAIGRSEMKDTDQATTFNGLSVTRTVTRSFEGPVQDWLVFPVV